MIRHRYSTLPGRWLQPMYQRPHSLPLCCLKIWISSLISRADHFLYCTFSLPFPCFLHMILKQTGKWLNSTDPRDRFLVFFIFSGWRLSPITISNVCPSICVAKVTYWQWPNSFNRIVKAYSYTYLYTHTHTNTHEDIHISICIYVCIYIHIYIYICRIQ